MVTPYGVLPCSAIDTLRQGNQVSNTNTGLPLDYNLYHILFLIGKVWLGLHIGHHYVA